MNFASVRLITDQVDHLVTFYERVTGQEAVRFTPDFAQLVLAGTTLAIAGTATLPAGSGVAGPAANRSAIVEFRVDDVDAEFARLRDTIGEVVQEPTTMPWGNRSLLFRDPDGTLINFFTPITPEAVARQRP